MGKQTYAESRRSRGARKSARRRTRISRSENSSLLILECDAATLATQSLSLADEAAAWARFFQPHARVEVVKTSTRQDLAHQFGRLAETRSRFRQLLVIGHSDQDRLWLTADGDVPWKAFASWVSPFRPTHLALVACQAGMPVPVITLFEEIRTLTSIYGSPLVVSKDQAQIVKALMAYLMNVKSPDDDVLVAGQWLNFLCTGGVIVHWRRRDLRNARMIGAGVEAARLLLAPLRG